MEIKSLTLQTNNIKKMREFYVDTFGFPVLMEDDHSFRIGIGSSELEFTSENVKGHPYYHFAFNIFANKFDEAKSWVKERVQLNVRDGEDEVYFSHFQAHAFYFYDPAGNIVEFISRPFTSKKGEEPFSIEGVLNISEIGLTVADAISAGEKLIEIGINERDNDPLSSTSLNFMGEKSKGIFILLNQPGREWIFSDKISAIYPMEITTSTNSKIIVNSEHILEVYKEKTN
ncbi:VOC family protein [Oceanobacillus longus]|uniref:VOC family protein n=1 Tax=Oceanobacillus longus TaxID=930120 RepID=A0ABV8GT09_9BACI